MPPVWIFATNLQRWKSFASSYKEGGGEKIIGEHLSSKLNCDYQKCAVFTYTLYLKTFYCISLQASDLILNLAKDQKLQQFLNNIPKKESMEGKEIYQPGCLRKVNKFY
jgi:hypothetical protein